MTFTTPMPNDDYSVVVSGVQNGIGTIYVLSSKTANGFDVRTQSPAGNFVAYGFGFVVHASNAVLPTTITAAEIAVLQATAPKAFGVIRGTGTVALLNGFGSTVTYLGTGQYRVNLSTALPSTDYCVVVTGASTGGNGSKGPYVDSTSTTSFIIYSYDEAGAFADNSRLSYTVFQN